MCNDCCNDILIGSVIITLCLECLMFYWAVFQIILLASSLIPRPGLSSYIIYTEYVIRY